jgi:hypothetical protein
MHADRTNRAMLILFAVLLVVAGAGGLIAGLGLLHKPVARQPILHNFVSTYVGAHGTWVWPVVGVVALLLLGFVLRWLAALLFTTDRFGNIDVRGDRSRGRSTVDDTALTSAVTAEIDTYRGVEHSRARLIGHSSEPALVVAVTALSGADVDRLRQQIESEALHHVRVALDQPDMVVHLDLSVSDRTVSRTSEEIRLIKG